MSKKFTNDLLAVSVFGGKELFEKDNYKNAFEVEYENGNDFVIQSVIYNDKSAGKYLSNEMKIGALGLLLNREFIFSKMENYLSKVNNFEYVENNDDKLMNLNGEKLTVEEKKFITLMFLHHYSVNDEEKMHYIFTSMIGLITENWDKISFIKIARKIYQAEIFRKRNEERKYRKNRRENNSTEIVVQEKFDILNLINPTSENCLWIWIRLYQHFYMFRKILPIPKKEELIFTVFHFGFYGMEIFQDVENREFILAIIHQDVEKMKKEAIGKNRYVYGPIMNRLGFDKNMIDEICDLCAPIKIVPGEKLKADF
jgi:hypothetical protein